MSACVYLEMECVWTVLTGGSGHLEGVGFNAQSCWPVSLCAFYLQLSKLHCPGLRLCRGWGGVALSRYWLLCESPSRLWSQGSSLARTGLRLFSFLPMRETAPWRVTGGGMIVRGPCSPVSQGTPPCAYPSGSFLKGSVTPLWLFLSVSSGLTGIQYLCRNLGTFVPWRWRWRAA